MALCPFGRYCELVLRPSSLCWGGVIESGDLFVYAVRDCGGGRWVSCLFWRGLMTLRGEAVAAEVVSMVVYIGRLAWGKTRGKIGADMQRAWEFCRAARRRYVAFTLRRGGRGRAAVAAEWARHLLVLVRLESWKRFECCLCEPCRLAQQVKGEQKK